MLLVCYYIIIFDQKISIIRKRYTIPLVQISLQVKYNILILQKGLFGTYAKVRKIKKKKHSLP